jgi:hypothetical protein
LNIEGCPLQEEESFELLNKTLKNLSNLKRVNLIGTSLADNLI